MAQERAWNAVWRRRVVYFATVAASLVLAARPFAERASQGLRTAEHGAAWRAIHALGNVLPSLASPWVNYYAANPSELMLGLVVLFVLMRWGGSLQSKICTTMRSIWLTVSPPPGFALDDLRAPDNLLYKIRTHPYYQGSFAVLRRDLLPTVFGLFILACLAALANRVPFEIANSLGGFCLSAVSDASQPPQIESAAFCNATGIRLEAGARYRVELLRSGREWSDASVDAPFPAGFSSLGREVGPFHRVLFTAFTPFRRVWSAKWFTPVGRIGATGYDQYILDSTTNYLTARTSGELFVFVNDTIFPLSISPFGVGWTKYYANNHGVADVHVTKIADAPSNGGGD
jgi:hypothetical protein